jgi:nucleoside 2-deoxyribosyltransferase
MGEVLRNPSFDVNRPASDGFRKTPHILRSFGQGRGNLGVGSILLTKACGAGLKDVEMASFMLRCDLLFGKLMKIYLAGPLFSEAERNWLKSIKAAIEILGDENYVLWPYELITREDNESLGSGAKQVIFQRCSSHLEDSDMLIAVLDGSQVDDGTAWEIGYFYARRKPGRKIIGIRTDFRRAGECEGSKVNAMIECSCDEVVQTLDELLGIIGKTDS